MIQVVSSYYENLLKTSNNDNVKIFGEFIDRPLKHEHLTLGFSPSRFSWKRRWRNNNTSAEFVADYFSTFFPSKDTSSRLALRRQSELKSGVSYITNELLENAMKYSYKNNEYPITLHLQFEERKMRIFVNNTITEATSEEYQLYINELLQSSPEEMYVHQLEKSLSEDSNLSRLGFLTVMNDYSAELGWKFQTIEPEIKLISVTTMAQLSI